MNRTFAIAALALVIAAPASGHEGPHDCSARDMTAMNHLNLWVDEVPAGGNLTRVLGFDGCPLSQGWWMFVWAETDARVDFALEHEGAPLANWSADGVRIQHAQIPTAGYPILRITNPGPEEVGFRLYFDQTCDCASKATFLPGPVWLNTPAKAGDEVRFDLRIAPFWPQLGNEPEMPQRVRVHLAHATPTADGPQAHQLAVVDFRPAEAEDCDPQFGGEICTTFTFTATRTGMQYIWVDIVEGPGDGWMVMVVPEVHVTKQAPLPWWTAVLALAVARQTLSRRRQPAA